MRIMEKQRHESLQRLLAIAAEVAKIEGPAALAFALAQSEQTVTNWGSRGVSKEGAMKAQARFGCSANWVLHNTLPRLIGDKALETQFRANPTSKTTPSDLDGMLQTLAGFLAGVSEKRRVSVVGLLTTLVHSPDDSEILDSLKSLLAPKAFQPQQKAKA